MGREKVVREGEGVGGGGGAREKLEERKRSEPWGGDIRREAASRLLDPSVSCCFCSGLGTLGHGNQNYGPPTSHSESGGGKRGEDKTNGGFSSSRNPRLH